MGKYTKKQKIIIPAIAVFILAVAGAGIWWGVVRSGERDAQTQERAQLAQQQKAERQENAATDEYLYGGTFESCDENFLQAYRSAMGLTSQSVESSKKFVDRVVKIEGYMKQPNCVQVLMNHATYVKNVDDIRRYADVLSELRLDGAPENVDMQVGHSPESARAIADALEKDPNTQTRGGF